MGRKYTKEDVQFHSDRMCDRAHPAINVKCYGFASISKIADHFGCDEAQAEKAANFAFESACQLFWEDKQDLAEGIFGGDVKVYSEGRSGGWLVVEGLKSLDNWNAIDLAKWRRFERIVKEEIKYRTSLSYIIDDIDSNQWHLEGAELYNFVDTKDGTTLCIAKLKQKARESGFGPVVRP